MNSINASLELVDRLDAALPQTQCRRCGYEGCRPYAEAIAGGAAINRCPPGGDALIATLARISGRPALALDRSCGETGPLTIASIDEAACIGCTLCIDACPVDAIVGAAKRMHTVLPVLCTGCALCLPPCPVDCISMIRAGRAWSPEDALEAGRRYGARNRRRTTAQAPLGPKSTLAMSGKDEEAGVAAPEDEETSAAANQETAAAAKRQAAVAAALARARARRVSSGNFRSKLPAPVRS